jgi:hypothetical protein
MVVVSIFSPDEMYSCLADVSPPNPVCSVLMPYGSNLYCLCLSLSTTGKWDSWYEGMREVGGLPMKASVPLLLRCCTNMPASATKPQRWK